MQWSISDKEMSESSQPDFGSPHNHCIFGWIGGGGGGGGRGSAVSTKWSTQPCCQRKKPVGYFSLEA